MSKITKKIFEDYKYSNKILKNYKISHHKNIDKIIEILNPYIDEKYTKDPCNHKITGFDFLNDNEYKIKELSVEYDWIKISEKEYYSICRDNQKFSFKTEIKYDCIFEPDYDEIYYKKGIKSREYLRVYVNEWWSYGGNDNVSYDFLLTEVMDEQYLRKEKLKRLEIINERN